MRADSLQADTEAILRGSPFSMEELLHWNLADAVEQFLPILKENLQRPLHFAAQMMVYLLLAGTISLLVENKGWRNCIETASVLGFGAMSLSEMAKLMREVGGAAAECQTYLAMFVPVYSGVAIISGQPGGAVVYSGIFLTASGILSSAIQKLLLPVMEIYFCVAACAAVWGNKGAADAAGFFSRCMLGLLKGSGVVLGFFLGFQNFLAAATDNAALKTGKTILTNSIPVVGGAAAVALGNAAAALQLLKGSLATALVVTIGGLFAPAILHSLFYQAMLSCAGIIASACDQKSCGQICHLYGEGAKICNAVLLLYFFMALLSTALLLITGMGGV